MCIKQALRDISYCGDGVSATTETKFFCLVTFHLGVFTTWFHPGKHGNRNVWGRAIFCPANWSARVEKSLGLRLSTIEEEDCFQIK